MPPKNQSILKRLRSHAQKRLVFDPGIQGTNNFHPTNVI